MAGASRISWQTEYNQRLATAEVAVRLVRSGNRIWVHPGNSTPEPLLDALVERASELRNVELLHMLTLGKAAYTHPRYAGSFRHNGLFLGPNTREAVSTGRADYTPVSLYEIETLFTSGDLPVDVAFIQVSPPDSYGYVSLGTGVDCTLTAASHAPRVVAEVNRNMPRTLGDTFLHVSRISAIVETARPLLELPPARSSEVTQRIARNVASLVPDGATLQIGIGGIGNEVLAALRGHRDLGIHTELCPDGIVPLIEAGVINGARKTLHPGKVVAGFVLGSQPLFDLIGGNPLFEFHPTSYVNDPFVIARNDNMHAVNCAIQVDLTGQVCADSMGTRPYSGVGGQPDFVRGAARSKGGKSIIALPSTAKEGAISRIVPVLDQGAGVVTPRSDTQYVVTEYGVAYLRGRTLRQRAEALIAIADPKFRDWLREAAARGNYLEAPSALVA
ncbi:MAG: 4-hydroxybutyrate CoA-transferase [Acidobacteriia bacterium]|nr:4-hydroxybutyrate CoA-transferase [Terriglobia bacterium]